MAIAGALARADDRFEFARTEMAVPVRLILYTNDAATANRAANAVFQRFHALNAILSDYDAASELRRLGATAGRGTAVAVSGDLWHVLRRAQALSVRSGGAFDVTVGPVVRLWRRARRRRQLPDQNTLRKALQRVDYRLVRLDADHHRAALLRSGMRLDVGGIAKGYAGDEALKVLAGLGVTRALIDAGGDMVLGDPPPGKPGWLIGIARLQGGLRPTRYLWLARRAVATSGDTWQFVEINGRRYSHIVNPHTGLGLTDHSNVTVVAPDGATADGLASAVSVLGPKRGLSLVDDTPGAAALILRAPNGKLETYQSARWRTLPVAHPAVDRGTRRSRTTSRSPADRP